MRKLVRDKIRFLPNRPGESFFFQNFQLCEPELLPFLLWDKLDEEIRELSEASTDEEIGLETVDCIEVLLNLAQTAGFDRQTILKMVEDKRLKKGGFDAGVVLVTE